MIPPVDQPKGELRTQLTEIAAQAYDDTLAGKRPNLNPFEAIADAVINALATKQAGVKERPITPPPRASDKPEWEQVNDLFERYGLASPDWRMRDELVGWLIWARYGSTAIPAAGVGEVVSLSDLDRANSSIQAKFDGKEITPPPAGELAGWTSDWVPAALREGREVNVLLTPKRDKQHVTPLYLAASPAVTERVQALEKALRQILRCEYESGDKYGITDCIDNTGQPYQSAHLAGVLAEAERLLGTASLKDTKP